jgi:ATPase subunit of ABC transporter with duplicated ATPase domains
MLIHLRIAEKSMGAKLLFEDLSLTIEERQIIAIIGRNGVGKSTLFRMITGEDEDYRGAIDIRKYVRIVSTEQEHFTVAEQTPLEYVLAHVPDFVRCRALIQNSDAMGEDMEKIVAYSDALQIFNDRDYYHTEDHVAQALLEMGLTLEQIVEPMGKLSGGEKRLMELVKVEFADADLALLDEPTNHLDAWGKAAFLRWLDGTKHSVLIITHDRDVLRHVNKILEIKDQRAKLYPGNYDAYLAQNTISTVTQVALYEEGLKRLATLKAQIKDTRVKKVAAFSSRFKTQEDRLTREYENLLDDLKRPSLWIDQASSTELDPEVRERYSQYKEKNIQVRTRDNREHGRTLLKIRALSLGYISPLFAHVQFQLAHGERVLLEGRNGAGKSTLVRAILATIANQDVDVPKPLESTIFEGSIQPMGIVRVGMYEQEMNSSELDIPLGDAIARAYSSKRMPLDVQSLRKILAQYLFDKDDAKLPLRHLSGGQ